MVFLVSFWLPLTLTILTFVTISAGAEVEPNLSGEFAEIKSGTKIDGINDFDEKGETYLTRAATRGNVNVVRNYLAGGADINLRNKNSYSALMLAAERGHYYTSTHLVKAGADLSFRNEAGMSAALFAAAAGKKDILQTMLDLAAA